MGGFTLIELMIVIAIATILLTIAAPSMVQTIQRNRIASEVANFVADLQYARSEGVKTGQSVSICPSSDGQTCLGSNTWQSGWIVFFDVNSTGTRDNTAADTVIRRRQSFTNGDTLIANPPLSAVTFGRIGFTSNLSAGPFLMTDSTSTPSTFTTQCVLLNQVGRQTVEYSGSGACI